MFVWRAIIKPLVDEVAAYEEFPREDALKVVRDLKDYCEKEGLFFTVEKDEAEQGR